MQSTESEEYSAEYRELQYIAEYIEWTVQCRVERVDRTVQSTESRQFCAEYR